VIDMNGDMRRGFAELRPLRVGIAGFGRVAAEAHVPAYRAHPRFDVVAVADPVSARRDFTQ